MFKLNDNKTGYEVYDDDGIYEETVKADLENFVDLLARGYKCHIINKDLYSILFPRTPVSGDHDHCYGCATMRKPCIDEVIL